MGKRKNPKKNPYKHSLPQLVVTQRLERKRSGAAGVHADQKTRVLGIAITNRVGSRSSSTAAAVKDSLRSNSRGEFFVALKSFGLPPFLVTPNRAL